MTGFNSQIGMNFIRRYDTNGDGLSKQEIQQGKMNSYFNMMTSMATGNASGLQAAMQDLQFASVAGQNFDILSQAAKTTPFGDNNANTISPLDLMKTASNDGNARSLTPQDVKSQYRQNAQAQNNNPMQQMMQMFMQMMQMMMQMMGMNNQNQTAYNNGLQDSGNNYGLPSNFSLPNTSGTSNTSFAGLYNNNSYSPSYNYSGVASGQGYYGSYGENESLLETIGGLPGSIMEGTGDLMIGAADWVQGGFDKVGETLGKIPVVGGLLEAGTKISGALFTAPTKIVGSVVKGVGSAVKSVGKSIGKALSKL